ncbi:MAG: D-galactarolactone cycloisomerase [Anaerolineae bacterium]|nr:D-galactarolactone cycloisomerase [Anaerolineae bacterium]
MKIANIETFVVRIPFDGERPVLTAGQRHSAPDVPVMLRAGHPGTARTEYPPAWRLKAVYTDFVEAVIVRIETDGGRVGWGEMHTPVAGEVAKAAADALLAPLLLGRDPRQIGPLWDAMYSSMRIRGHFNGFLMEAISGVDMALWDILGKAAGVSACKLMGGQVRDRVPLYASCLPSVSVSAGEAGIADVVAAAQGLVARGFTTLKVKVGVRLDIDRALIGALRSALGPRVGIAVYAGGAYDFPYARQAGRMLEDFDVLWLEEPLAPELRRDYARLTRALDIAVAGGGALAGRWAFNDYLADGAFDLIKPDVGRAGGLSECRKIGMLADTYGLPVALHISRGTAIYQAASVQWAAAAPNLMICEWPMDQTAASEGILQTPFTVEGGFVAVPSLPGLGITVDEAALRRWQAAPA